MGSVSLEPGVEKLLFAYWTSDQCATILAYLGLDLRFKPKPKIFSLDND